MVESDKQALGWIVASICQHCSGLQEPCRRHAGEMQERLP